MLVLLRVVSAAACEVAREACSEAPPCEIGATTIDPPRINLMPPAHAILGTAWELV